MKPYYKIFFILLAGVVLTGCYGKYDDMKKEDLIKPKSWASNPKISISDLISTYGTETGVYFPVRPNSGSLNLYSVDTIPVYGPDVIIEGIVVSSDVQGNVYKSFYIQDVNDTKTGIKISVDASGLSSVVPLGQKIAIRCNGLAIGKYADMFQLGTVAFNKADSAGLDATTYSREKAKEGFEVGRISYPIFSDKYSIDSWAGPNSVKIHTMTIPEIISAGRAVHSRIVRINNVHFVDDYLPFAEDTKGIGFPTSRLIADNAGNQIGVSTSEYARFANALTPEGNLKGDIIAIVSWYRDRATNNGEFQLVIRSLDDLIGFEE